PAEFFFPAGFYSYLHNCMHSLYSVKYIEFSLKCHSGMKEGIKTSYIIISNSKKMIDLRSDTVTRPSAGILERMMKAWEYLRG
ncbi:MAG TPA: hypothetical protein PKE28_12645, partial [Bacteroidales bacterium]|nr:hypothetical protein [Bacteroidales bacterium]